MAVFWKRLSDKLAFSVLPTPSRLAGSTDGFHYHNHFILISLGTSMDYVILTLSSACNRRRGPAATALPGFLRRSLRLSVDQGFDLNHYVFR